MGSGNLGKVFRARTRFSGLPLLAVSLAVGSCTFQKSPSVALSAPTLQLEAFSEGDSTHLARALQRECRKSAERSACYEKLLASTASTGRVRLAMGALG